MGPSALLAVCALWWVEHDDLADVQRLEDAVDQYALMGYERWFHRAAGNLVWLDEPGLDRDRKSDRDHCGRDQLR
jgi:hypothetical protein